jgi:hypothetical protein
MNKFTNYFKEGSIKGKMLIYFFIFLFLWLSMAGIAVAQTVTLNFSDVSQKTSLWPYINYLATKNVINGFPNGTFHPEGNITRAQAAKILVRAAGLKEPALTYLPFKDVAKSHWAYNPIEAAAAAGLLKGYPDGTYKPEKALTRAESVCLLLRLSSKPLPQVDMPYLKDVDVNHWAGRQIIAALDMGLIELAGEKTFAPVKPCTRGEMARGLALMMTLSPDLRKTPLKPKLVAKKGTVTVLSPGFTSPWVVSTKYEVKIGDIIQVEKDGVGEIVFEDGSGIRIEADTKLEVVKMEGAAFLRTNGTIGSALDYLEVNLKKGKMFGALASPYTIVKEEQMSEKTTVESNKSQLTLLSWHQPRYKFQSAVLRNNKGLPLLLTYNDRNMINLVATTSPAVQKREEVPWWKASTTKRTKVKINMPWGVAGIRGSFWMNDVIPDVQEITNILLGEAEVTCSSQTVVVHDGYSTKVTRAGSPPSTPFQMAREEWNAWLAVKDWVIERAQEIQHQLGQNLSFDPKTILLLEKRLKQILPPEIVKAVIEALTRAESEAGSAPGGGGGPGGGGPGYVVPMLTFQPTSKQVVAGEEFEVNLLVQNVQDLYGADIQFKYDPEKLKVISVEVGEEWKGAKGFSDIKNKEGKLSLVMIRKAPYSGCSGTVVFSALRFKALSKGNADLEFTFHELASSIPVLITHQTEKGSVGITD